MSGRSSESSWWVDRLWSSLLYPVVDSGLTAYWCRWRCLVDLQRAAGGLTGCGAACCTRLKNSGLAAYWCRWRGLVDLQRAAGGLSGSGAACCTRLKTVA